MLTRSKLLTALTKWLYSLDIEASIDIETPILNNFGDHHIVKIFAYGLQGAELVGDTVTLTMHDYVSEVGNVCVENVTEKYDHPNCSDFSSILEDLAADVRKSPFDSFKLVVKVDLSKTIQLIAYGVIEIIDDRTLHLESSYLVNGEDLMAKISNIVSSSEYLMQGEMDLDA